MQLVLVPKHVAQIGLHVAQVDEFTSPYVPGGHLSAETQLELVRKSVAHEVQEELLVQLPHGGTQGTQIVDELYKVGGHMPRHLF